jgi:glycerol uptake facilitator protein
MDIYIGEVVGTGILVLLGCGINANMTLEKSFGQNGGWLITSLGWGLAVAIAAYSVGRISGAHLNPAVTLGLASIGDFEWAKVPGYFAAQMIGALIGSTLVFLAHFKHWEETESPEDKLGVFSTGPAIPHGPANLITEIIGTAMLLFGILAIGATSQEFSATGVVDLSVVYSTGLNPLLVGSLVAVIGMALGGPTGFAINPARDLGPRIAHALLPIAGKGDSNWGYSWVPVAGPLIGGVVGALLFRAVGF